MDLLKNITSPLRKKDAYSSQRNLVDEEASLNYDMDLDILVESPGKTEVKDAFNEKKNSFPSGLPKSDKDEKVKSALKTSKALMRNKSSEKNHLIDNSSSDEIYQQTLSNISYSSPKNTILKQTEKLRKIDSDDSIRILNSEKSLSSKDVSKNDKKSNRSEPIKIYSDSKKKEEKQSRKSSILDKSNEIKEDIEDNKHKQNDVYELRVMGVHIHKSEVLKNHPFLCNPIVQVYIFDIESGKCLNEKNGENIILSTKSFNFSNHRSVLPQWNELVVFDDFLILEMTKYKRISIFFEILDIKLMKQNKKREAPVETLSIAWAFLKPIGEKSELNVNRKIKLQLYENMKQASGSTNGQHIYEYWKKKPWTVYPSTLHVTLKALQIHQAQEFVNNIRYVNFKDINNEQNIPISIKNTKKIESTEMSELRQNNEQCKLPNNLKRSLLISEKGCFVLKYSRCGKYLAYSAKHNENDVIFILQVPEYTQVAKLIKHKSIIYDICWNFANNVVISASADTTVCIWKIENSKYKLFQQLNHPSFVYCSQFCMQDDEIVVSGCYDKIVRIWLTKKDKYEIHQELCDHEGFINAIAFAKKGKTFYSGDSNGLIIRWNYENKYWVKLLTIKSLEIVGHMINDLVIFPDNQRMLVVLRNSVSWTLDLSTSASLLCYRGGIKYKYQIRGCVSPCGNLIFIGNCVWNATSGHLLAMYNPSLFDHHKITAIDYHPYYHSIALTCGFVIAPLLVCNYQGNNTCDTNLNMELSDLYIDQNSSLLTGETNRKLIDNESYRKINNDMKHGNISAEVEKRKPEFSDKYSNLNQYTGDGIHSTKLWDLINKMDNVLLIAKKGHKYKEPHSKQTVLKNNNEKELQKSDSISNETFSVDLTQFHSRIHTILNNNENLSVYNGSNSEGTYVIHKSLQDKDALLSYEMNHLTDISSTMSAAESLEDDMQTYTIPTKENSV